MSDRLDKELGRHVRAVFDAYEEPFDADQWARLQRKRRGAVIGLYLRRGGVAAAVAVLLAAGALLWNKPANEIPTVEIAASGKTRPAQEETPSTATPEQQDRPDEQQTPGIADGTVPAEISRPSESTTPETGLQEAALPSGQEPVLAGVQSANLPDSDEASLNPGNPAATPEEQEEALVANHGQSDTGDEPQSLAGGQEQPRDRNQEPPVTVNEEQLAAGNQGRSTAGALPVKAETRGSRFSLGFVTTSLMNYADGNTASDVHFGAGITSGWKINDRLSVHSGVILAQNSLSLNRSNSSVRASNYVIGRAANTEILAFGKNNIVQDVSSNSMDVNLLVVDIPLNMTYRIGIGSSNLLLTGGLSSFAYLDQEYSYHNTMQLYNNVSVDAPEPVIRDENAFSHFDFARQLNIAIGTELPLGNGSVLILEPYLKYPLGTLTSEHIRFGSAGMNLRFSIGTK